jgi:hypothetical protein
MAPTNGLPKYSNNLFWTLKRSIGIRFCDTSGSVIWPWDMAWCETLDKLYGGKAYSSTYRWVSEDTYLLMKLKGEI